MANSVHEPCSAAKQKALKFHSRFTHPNPFSVYDAKTKRSLKRAPSQQAACKPTSLCPTHLAGDVR